MLKSNINLLFSLALVLLLGACSSTKLPGPSPIEYAEMSKEERAAAKTAVANLAEGFRAYWKDIGEPLYLSHQPVRMGAKDSGYTLQWLRLPGDKDAVAFYQGHNPEGTGNVTEAMYTAVADKKGNILWQENGKGGFAPNKLLANVSTAEDLTRLWIRGVLQMGAAGVNGVGAAIVNKKMDCDDCGIGSAVINQVTAGAISGSEANAIGKGSASAGPCVGSDCVPVPMR